LSKVDDIGESILRPYETAEFSVVSCLTSY